MHCFLRVILLLGVVSLSLVSKQILAQQPLRGTLPVCATPDLPDSGRRALTNQAVLALSTKLAANGTAPTITYVPIRPRIFRRSNGTGGMTLAKMNNVMAITNSYYLSNGSGIQFYFFGTTPDYIDSDNLCTSFSAFNEAGIKVCDAPNAMKQYYVRARQRPLPTTSMEKMIRPGSICVPTPCER